MRDPLGLGLGWAAFGCVGGAAAAVSYEAAPVVFEAGDNLRNASDLTGIADSSAGYISVWFRFPVSTGEKFFICNNNRFRLSKVTAGTVQIFAANAGGTTVLHIRTLKRYDDNLWHHFVASWGTDNHIYVDGVSDLEVVVNNPGAGAIDYTAAPWQIGCRWDQANDFVGEMADLIFKPGQYIDLSVQANLEQFYVPATRKPKNPVDIEAAFGEPSVQMYGEVGTWHENKGSGGGFAVIAGALAAGTELPVQWPIHITQTFIDTGLTDGDPIDTVDITGNGLFDILFITERGLWYWYEQTVAGSFTRHSIDASEIGVNGAFEACAWADFDGDGEFEAYGADQNGGDIWCYVQDIPGTPTGTWTGAVIRTGRNNLQAMQHHTIDGTKCLIYTWEGTGAGAGGVNCLTFNGGDPLNPANWTDTVLIQHNGAWALDPDGLATRGASTILYFGARNRLNNAAVPGAFYLTKPAGSFLQAWAETTVFQNANDWTRITRGDFFGDGNGVDIAQHDSGNQGATDVTIKLYRSADNFATSVTLTAPPLNARYNLRNITPVSGQINGRDVLIGFGGATKGTQGFAVLWCWAGTSWEYAKTNIETQKVDGPIKIVQVAGSATPDLLVSDSFSNKISWLDGDGFVLGVAGFTALMFAGQELLFAGQGVVF